MFKLLRRRQDVSEARVEPEVSETAQASGDSKSSGAINRNDRAEASSPPTTSDAPAELGGPHTESGAGKIDREAIVAFNVKAICDGARLVSDKASYEHFRNEAIDMTLSLRSGSYRAFALDQVVGLCRRSGEVHVARALYEKVADPALRARMLSACPELRLLVPLNTNYPRK
jgi:hypothetical protein